MRTRSLLVSLTLINLALLAYQVIPLDSADAAVDDAILRGSGLEIVDHEGRLRAQIVLAPADPTFAMPDGTTGYPETVILRLITADGKPRVKVTTSADGSGLMLLGASDETRAVIQADHDHTTLDLRDSEARQRLLEP